MTLEQLSQLGPVATGVAALVALLVGGITLIQRRRADGRSEWWRRTQWATDVATCGDLSREVVGFKVLRVLSHSKLARTEELIIFEALWDALLLDNGVDLADDGTEFILVDENDDHDDDLEGGP